MSRERDFYIQNSIAEWNNENDIDDAAISSCEKEDAKITGDLQIVTGQKSRWANLFSARSLLDIKGRRRH